MKPRNVREHATAEPLAGRHVAFRGGLVVDSTAHAERLLAEIAAPPIRPEPDVGGRRW